VAWGYEEWGGTPVPVTKVQMVYNGRVNGRISPSYPDNTPDKDNVRAAEDLVAQGWGANWRNERIVLCSVTVNSEQNIDNIIEQVEDELLDGLLNSVRPQTVGSVECIEETQIEENHYRLIFKLAPVLSVTES